VPTGSQVWLAGTWATGDQSDDWARVVDRAGRDTDRPTGGLHRQISANYSAIEKWALLDRFDVLAYTYDSPQVAATEQRWSEDARLFRIEVGHWSHLVGRGTKAV